jgi:uncharacterized membrane protein YoaT (DUF817 family)
MDGFCNFDIFKNYWTMSHTFMDKNDCLLIKFYYCLIFLQAFTLGEFPAPMSLSAITSFFGGLITTAAQLIEYHEFKTGWPLVSAGDMIGYSVLVILLLTIQCTLLIKKRRRVIDK